MDLGRDYERLKHGSQNETPYGFGDEYGGSRTMGPPSTYNQPTEQYRNPRPSSMQSNLDYKPYTGKVSPTDSLCGTEYPPFLDHLDNVDPMMTEGSLPGHKGSNKPHHSQKRANRDEFDGPTQLLKKPPVERIMAQDRTLPHVPITLDASEQDEVLSRVNAHLSQCAFDFVAKYQFPIPLEPDKRPVTKPSDREWTEWVYLLKRLATKRRIPARVLYNGQIKQLVTVLENSLEMRHAAAHQSRPPKDDRNVLQLVSAGTQVAKMLKDADTMEDLDRLYKDTERTIQQRKLAPMTSRG